MSKCRSLSFIFAKNMAILFCLHLWAFFSSRKCSSHQTFDFSSICFGFLFMNTYYLFSPLAVSPTSDLSLFILECLK